VFSPEVLTTAMTGGTMHYPREKSPQRIAPTIEELKDRKCLIDVLSIVTSHISFIINAMFLVL
jgi:hypothetical protein